jgi:UDP-glucose 4-epimerase
MTSCIIGGSGFIGRHLIQELIATGRKVISIGRSNFQEAHVQHIQVRTLFDKKMQELLENGVDEIIYLAYATKPKTSFDHPIRDIEENLPQAVHLFEIVSKIKSIQKIVYVSSGGTVYGNTDDELIAEDHSKKPISPYGITKLTIEQFANMFCEIYGLPVVIVRPSNAYGIGQLAREGQGFIAYAMKAVLHNQPIHIYGPSGTIRDYIYVSDIAKAIRSCLDSAGAGTTFNVGSGQGYSNLEIVQALQTIVEQDKYSITVTHGDARPFDVNRNVLDTSAISQALGWQPTIPLQKGLSLMWEWASQQVAGEQKNSKVN